MKQIAQNAWMGSGTEVNWLVVREGDNLTLVDSGWPGDVDRLEASIAEIGHRTADISAVLLTHAHVDHTGALNELWRRHQTPVFMHPSEVPLATGVRREQATPLDVISRAWRPRVAVWGVNIARAGAMNHPQIAHAQAWSEGPLDLPGRPVPVPCEGHTSGHTSYLFPGLGILAAGDALVTGHPVSGKHTPHLLPDFFNTSIDRARGALNQLAAIDADQVVPGHGQLWVGSVRAAVELAAQDYDKAQR